MSDKLINYKASATAQEFHRDDSFVRGVMGPFGCLGADTKVVTENGLKAISEITGEERVLSWNEKSNRYQLSPTSGGFPKGSDYLYRVVTTHGEFDAAGHHQLLCADGSYQRVDTLAQGQTLSQCLHDPRQTSSSMFLRSLPLDEPRYSQIVLDYLAHCGSLARQYGQQLLSGEDISSAFAPSQADAQVLYDYDAYAGGREERTQQHTRPSLYAGLQSNRGSCSHSEHRGLTLSNHASSLLCGHTSGSAQQFVLYLLTSVSRLTAQLFSLCSGSNRSSISNGSIISIERKDYQEEYWDLQVLDTNNYITEDGAIHHNSGKSVMMVFEIFLRAKAMKPCSDGIRRSRWIIARNTQPQLETTTIKTWLDWFPEHIFGKMSRKPPFTHRVKLMDMELEVIFLALDKPDDVNKLLSFEVTGVFFNEAREMEYEIIAGATGRVGRYPSKKDKPDDVPDDQWPSWYGIIMDTNPPTDDHWWYKMAEEQAWAVDKFGNPIDVEDVPKRLRWKFWKQPSGLDEKAENIENLPGGTDYYKQQLGGKTEEWINVYVHGNYGFIKSGLPVYKGAWNPDVHMAKDRITIPAGGKIYAGVDASGRHPAAIFLYRTLNGQLQVLHELCIQSDEGLGAVSFARLLKQEMATVFPSHDFEIWGDPAGAWASQNDERTYFDILRGEGIFIKPSPGLRIPERIEAVISTLSRNVQGQPAMVVSPSCKVLGRGMNGGYRYRKLNTSGGGRYDEKPDKNRYSDVQDALQYVLCGMGELRKMYGRGTRSNQKTVFADAGYKI